MFLSFFVGILLLCLHHATPNATKKQSVSYTQTEFIEEIAPTIQKVAASYGVRPSIIIAQAVLESNYGTNLLAVKYHNLFAVQAQDGQMSIELTYKSYLSMSGRLRQVALRFINLGQLLFMTILIYYNLAH